MTDQADGHNKIPFGPISLLVMAALVLYSLLPSWFRPVPPLFVLFLLAGLIVSLISAIIAGVRSSRLWLIATLLPIAFFLMLLNFEQSTEVKISEKSGDTTFVLSGSGTLTDFVVFSPEYLTSAQTPNDMRFALWCIQPADHQGWGEPVWRIRSIRYGIVPEGYIQCAPLEGKPEPLRDSRVPYLLSVTTASAPGTAGYFTVEGGRAQWAKNQPDGPCFTMENGKYKRAQCLHSASCQTDSQAVPTTTCR
ncbi:MAG: hypothetical protein JWO71_1037 [Candidatus Acidoferrum typicum]|nr:hypothetical protein [Candidatus Acidoferrum typicum]